MISLGRVDTKRAANAASTRSRVARRPHEPGFVGERLKKRAEVVRGYFAEPVVQFLLPAPVSELRFEVAPPRGATHNHFVDRDRLGEPPGPG